MQFTDIFIRRPVLALVISLLIIIAGLQAVRSLNVRQYPRSDNASVTVNTIYVGASADLVRGFITTPLERAIAAADGIDYIKSESRLGLSTITVRLKLNYDPTKALSEISSKVDQVRGDLPPVTMTWRNGKGNKSSIFEEKNLPYWGASVQIGRASCRERV
mgnify:CR=1 FL=1